MVDASRCFGGAIYFVFTILLRLTRDLESRWSHTTLHNTRKVQDRNFKSLTSTDHVTLGSGDVIVVLQNDVCASCF